MWSKKASAPFRLLDLNFVSSTSFHPEQASDLADVPRLSFLLLLLKLFCARSIRALKLVAKSVSYHFFFFNTSNCHTSERKSSAVMGPPERSVPERGPDTLLPRGLHRPALRPLWGLERLPRGCEGAS